MAACLWNLKIAGLSTRSAAQLAPSQLVAMAGHATIFLSLLILSYSAASFTSITNKLQDFLFEYPGPAISERDLPICKPHSVCSIVHRRFWALPVVERLCRCLRRIECPYQWSDPPDNFTMLLDNRSQLKDLCHSVSLNANVLKALPLLQFCDTVTLLPECNETVTALTLNVQNRLSPPETKDNQANDDEGRTMDVKVSCYCPSRNQWENQLEKESTVREDDTTAVTSYYLCKSLYRCDTYVLCGHVRADYYSTYYRCTCPMGHMCINNDRKRHNATELLYWGAVLKAYCVPNP